MEQKQPNIVFIMTDQMRGDCMGIAGHPDVKTPFLDTLAARGTLFDRAYSACPSCIAARAALHTGLSQEKHGRVGYQDRGNVSISPYHGRRAGKSRILYAVCRKNARAPAAQSDGIS